MKDLINTVHCMDCLEFMALLPDHSINAIITDLPYGTTACSWDEIIPFAPMWAAVKRILKPRGVFVTTASQPFTSKLVMSNLEWFKYEWIWDKANHSNPFLAQSQPLRVHENILVFSEDGNTYHPQMRQGKMMQKGGYSNRLWKGGDKSTVSNQYYPVSILRMPTGTKYDYLHETQKPVELYEYLVRTYTQPGELVLDFCCGSGTTLLAAAKTGRDYIGCDITPKYVKIARDRVNAGFVTLDVAEGISQPSLFGEGWK